MYIIAAFKDVFFRLRNVSNVAPWVLEQLGKKPLAKAQPPP